MSDELSRQEALGIPPEALKRNITVLGAGGIGSPAVLGLTKTGFEKISVIDYDIVEEHNVGSQLYDPRDIGELKSDALIDKAMSFMGKEQSLISIPAQIRMPMEMTEFIKDTDILVLAVDNNRARYNAIAAAVQEHEEGGRIKYVVDARLNGFQSTVYSVDLSNKEERDKYMKSLEYQDGTTQACVQPATFCMGLLTGGRIVLETLKRSLEMEGIGVQPKFNTWEDAYNNIITTEQELFD
jgi:molybdopterin/thiamine biosynthesis adenylyltransferase